MERKKFRDSGKLRLKSFADLDGRTAAYKSAQSLRNAIAADLGGADTLSAMQQAIVNNAAMLGAMLENIAARYLAGEVVDYAQFATLANSMRRLLADLGLERKAHDISPDLRTYLKGKAA
jgi:hypothetical protein